MTYYTRVSVFVIALLAAHIPGYLAKTVAHDSKKMTLEDYQILDGALAILRIPHDIDSLARGPFWLKDYKHPFAFNCSTIRCAATKRGAGVSSEGVMTCTLPERLLGTDYGARFYLVQHQEGLGLRLRDSDLEFNDLLQVFMCFVSNFPWKV